MILLMNGQRVTVEVSEEQKKEVKIECTFCKLPGLKGDCGGLRVFQVNLTGHGRHMESNRLYLARGITTNEKIPYVFPGMRY